MTISERIKKLFRFEKLDVLDEKFEQTMETFSNTYIEDHKPNIAMTREELLKEVRNYVEEQRKRHERTR
jgi:hypothetical protein